MKKRVLQRSLALATSGAMGLAFLTGVPAQASGTFELEVKESSYEGWESASGKNLRYSGFELTPGSFGSATNESEFNDFLAIRVENADGIPVNVDLDSDVDDGYQAFEYDDEYRSRSEAQRVFAEWLDGENAESNYLEITSAVIDRDDETLTIEFDSMPSMVVEGEKFVLDVNAINEDLPGDTPDPVKAVSATTASGIDTTTHELVLTVLAGHGFVANDPVIVSGLDGAGDTDLNGTYTVFSTTATTVTVRRATGVGDIDDNDPLTDGAGSVEKVGSTREDDVELSLEAIQDDAFTVIDVASNEIVLDLSSNEAGVDVIEAMDAAAMADLNLLSTGTGDEAQADFILYPGAGFDGVSAEWYYGSDMIYGVGNQLDEADDPDFGDDWTIASLAAGQVKVTFWIDEDEDGKIDAGEARSNSVTLTWVDEEDSSASLSVDFPAEGDESVTLTISGGSINWEANAFYSEESDGDFGHNLLVAITGDVTDDADPFNVSDEMYDYFKGSTSDCEPNSSGALVCEINTSVLDEEDEFTVSLYVDIDDNGEVTTEDGDLLYDILLADLDVTVEDATADVITMNAVAAATVKSVTRAEKEGASAPNSAAFEDDQDGSALVKVGTSTFDVRVFVGGANAKAVADATVEVIVDPSTGITSGDSLEVGGEDVTTSGGDVTFRVQTNASGVATIKVSSAGVDNGESITLSTEVQGLESTDLVITWQTSTFEVYDELGGSNRRSVAVGGTLAMNYLVADQWGASPTDNTYRVVLEDKSSTGRTKGADFALTQNVVGGKASFSVTDNGTGTGTQVVAAKLGLLSAVATEKLATTISVVADPAAASITVAALDEEDYGANQLLDENVDGDYKDDDDVDNRSKLIIESVAGKNYDGRISAPTVSAPAVDEDNLVTISGTVKNAAGTAVAGALVTLKATGMLFRSGSVFAIDQITVVASASGVYSVDVWSNVGGARAIAITSGAATATQTLTYETGITAVADFTVTAPASSLPGKTADVTVTAKDKFGNAVPGASVTLSSTGPGYLINTSGSTMTDGTFSTKLLVGNTDTGTAVIKVTMTIAGVSTTKTVSMTVAAPEVKAVIGSFNGRVAVRVENAKGSTISVKIGRTWYKYSSLSDNYLKSWVSRKGASVAVSVYVDAELQNVQTITVK